MAAEVSSFHTLHCLVTGWRDADLCFRDNSCPMCRAGVVKATDDFRAKSLVQLYYKMKPSKKPSQADLEERDMSYKNGDVVYPPTNTPVLSSYRCLQKY